MLFKPFNSARVSLCHTLNSSSRQMIHLHTNSSFFSAAGSGESNFFSVYGGN